MRSSTLIFFKKEDFSNPTLNFQTLIVKGTKRVLKVPTNVMVKINFFIHLLNEILEFRKQ